MKKLLIILIPLLFLVSCRVEKKVDGLTDDDEAIVEPDSGAGEEKNPEDTDDEKEETKMVQFPSGGLDAVYAALMEGNYSVTITSLSLDYDIYYKFDSVVEKRKVGTSFEYQCSEGLGVSNNDPDGLTYIDPNKQYMKLGGTWYFMQSDDVLVTAVLSMASVCGYDENGSSYWTKKLDSVKRKYYYTNNGTNILMIDDDTVTITFGEGNEKNIKGIANKIKKVVFTNIRKTEVEKPSGIDSAILYHE